MLAATALAPAPALPVLAMPQLVVVVGFFPMQPGGPGYSSVPSQLNMGMIQPFAGMAAYGAPPGQGQMLPVANYMDLSQLFQTNFGGDGNSNFGIPNLKGRTAIGGSPLGEIGQQTLTLNYLISLGDGTFGPDDVGFPLMGMIMACAGDYVPVGWLAADGTMMSVEANQGLFARLQEDAPSGDCPYGGDNREVFALPNLNGAAPVGAGQGPGLPPVALGQKVSGTVPGLGLNYLICTTGPFPPPDDDGTFPWSNAPFLGQVVAYAGAVPPTPAWALCDGTLLPISSNAQLYALLGTTYGGDGHTVFALPDLRGRMLIGT
jgi:microcystin-dependent protein